MKSKNLLSGVIIGMAIFLANFSAQGQVNLSIYSDRLNSGFQDWSFSPHSLTNTSPVHAGSYSIRVDSANWQALSFEHSDFDTTPYTNLSFWINGGTGGQIIVVQGLLSFTNTANSYQIPTLPSNTWQLITIPLSALGVANKTNFDRFWLQLTASGTTNSYYVDDIQFTAKPPPALIHIGINAAQTNRLVDARWFGINTAVWDGYLDTPQTVSLLNEMGLQALRFPGGSLSDDYHWASNTTDSNTWTWGTSFGNFAHVATNTGAQAMITVNYGTGTPAEAAAWVKNSNVTNHYAFKYWEVGNENYGTWETDSNTSPHDAYTYATRAQQYIQQMRAADPTIKIGLVVAPGETSYANGYSSHPAYNARTGQTNYGWTAVLLTTLKTLGVTPDFFIHHRYPEYTGNENDATLLQGTGGWIGDAADLRQQIKDYYGTNGANIELLCTENNSSSGDQSKQSVSLVNGLYYADSLAQIMQTEFNAFFWWDLRNGIDNSGSLDPSLYGWRLYGDIGTIDGLGTALTNRYPHFFTAKLMQYFARSGDAVIAATSDYSYLSAYAVRRTNGALTLLVINKDPGNTFTTQIGMNGFVPTTSAAVRSYGIPQDTAAQTGVGSPDIALTNLSVAGTNFNCAFAPYSATVLSFAPSAPVLVLLPAPRSSNTFVLQLQGQAGVRYVMQTSTNQLAWTPVSTNTMLASSLNFTNTIAFGAGARYWRAYWQP